MEREEVGDWMGLASVFRMAVSAIRCNACADIEQRGGVGGERVSAGIGTGEKRVLLGPHTHAH